MRRLSFGDPISTRAEVGGWWKLREAVDGLNARSWQRDAKVSIDMGLGALELWIPGGLGVRLRKDGFLVSLDSEGLVKRGDAYYSRDWEDADRKVTIDLDAAFGSVNVEWVR